ncbi:MAG: glycoside hydrolase family 5 protein [Oscillospiraceae bacterium]|jgi:endoglycosylceramidase|nr:glycoside hydrolase family 5 protein [Oscillospiraceae bacterium]
MQHIRAQGLRFVDEQGRERIFRGVNACEKDVAEEEKSYDRFCLNLDDAFFLRCNALGFNVIRLGLCWEILEPEKGKFNEAYLRSVDEIFRRAAQYGVYIFLDMHQDLYSSFGINCGDGAPLWATLTDGYRAKPAKLVWAEGYFWGKAVQRAFDHFWNNDPVQGLGLQEHFAGLWQMLARRYAGQPAFFGFDLFNEPYPGTEGGRVFRRMIARLLRYALTSPQMHRIKFLKALFAKGDKAKALHFLARRMLREVTSAADGLIRKFDLER